jgi:zinc protease
MIYGESNILATELSGTTASVEALTIDDLKAFYEKNFSPSVSQIIVAGDIGLARVEKAFESLSSKWQDKEVKLTQLQVPEAPVKSQIYFVDVPGSKQSVIYIGAPSLKRTDPDYNPAYVTNYKLGGSFNGIFNLILREEKGFTYGARSYFSSGKNYGSFNAMSMVRTNSTLESVTIFKTEMEKYRKEMPQEYIDFTKSALLKGNALNFETLWDLLNMLSTMAMYGLPADYIKQEEAYIKNLTVEKQLEVANKYIDPARMYYVVVGDAKTQLKELEKAGLGKPVLYKN